MTVQLINIISIHLYSVGIKQIKCGLDMLAHYALESN